MMIFDEFAAELQRELESKIDGVTIRSNRVRKNNGIELLGLSICSEGSSVAPTVYVNDYYRAYTSGVPMLMIRGSVLMWMQINSVIWSMLSPISYTAL